MNKYNIVYQNGDEEAVTVSVFKTAFKSREYKLYTQGGVYVLLHKQNTSAIAAYKVHNSDITNQTNKLDRLGRCLDTNGNVCVKDCRLCDKERQSRIPVSLNERIDEFGLDIEDSESDISAKVINKILRGHLDDVINVLPENEQHIIKALYGFCDCSMSISEFSETEGIDYYTARDLRNKALRRLAKISVHLRSFLS